MNPKADQLKARTKAFALAVLALKRTLPATDEARDVGRQLSRAATGVAANYRAVCRARSDAEFLAKLGIALEEADEAAFWLEVMTEDRMSVAREAFALLDEANQLTAILAASAVTVSQRLDQKRTGYASGRRPKPI